MKFLTHFNTFLASEVNLSQARLDQLDERVSALDSFLSSGGDEIATRFVQTIPQGSYAHRTIINPVDDNDEFDADVLLELREEPGWSARDYVEELYRAFRASNRYRGMVSRHARCVKVDYANEFHIDVVPYVERHGEHYICNRDNDEFELTNPEGFNEWLDQQDQITGGKLIKVIRLLKYLRDYKNTFSVKSVILNILLGGRVNSAWLLGDSDHYKDLPTAFNNLLADLNAYLQANPTMPMLTDPSCPSEDFNHRCDQAQYANLRKWIKYYSDKATAAFGETDRETSLKLWREIFGDDFGITSTTVTKATEAHVGRATNTEQFLEQDLRIPVRTDPRYRLTLGARVLPKPGFRGFRTYDLQKHGNVVGKGRTIRFSLAKCTVPGPYDVYWKVRNTGEEAIRANCIRGQIKRDDGSRYRDEPTAYRGKHYVECYVVKNGECVAYAHQNVIIK